MSYIVYRDCPPRQRQYLRRIPGPTLYLWHHDLALALALDNQRANRLADWFQVSSHWPRDNSIWKNYQPAGDYGLQEVTP